MEELRGRRAYVVESEYLLLKPEGARRPPVVLLLHGHGDTAERFAARLGLLPSLDAALLVPGGPIPVEIGGALDPGGEPQRVGQAWYCYDGDQDRFQESLEEVESYLDALLEEARKRGDVDTGRLVVVGYSMGAYVAGFFALRRKPRPLGLGLIAGRLKHEFLDKELQGLDGFPVLLAHGSGDTRFPAARAEDGRRKLERAGAGITTYVHGGGHGLGPDVVGRLGSWLKSVLAG